MGESETEKHGDREKETDWGENKGEQDREKEIDGEKDRGRQTTHYLDG